MSKAADIYSPPDEMVPVTWMGANRVETIMVRKQDAPLRGSKRSVIRQKEEERAKWKRLANASAKLVSRLEDEQTANEPVATQPDMIADSTHRSKMLSTLRPAPDLQRLEDATPADITRDAEDAEEDEAREAERSASSLITSVVRGQNTRSGKKVMCPFSGCMVVCAELPAHMEDWRAMMRAELISLKQDAVYGPRLGLFAVPSIPDKQVPTEESSPEEIEEWNEVAVETLKNGYVLCKPEMKKYHWTELRQRLDNPGPTPRPWRTAAPDSILGSP